MGLLQYRIGRRHGRQGKPYLIHRNSRRYDGASANDSYLWGYKYGEKERYNEISARRDHELEGRDREDHRL